MATIFCIDKQVLEIIGTYEGTSSYFDFWCIWNKIFSSKVFTTRKMILHQQTNEVFSELLPRKASVDMLQVP